MKSSLSQTKAKSLRHTREDKHISDTQHIRNHLRGNALLPLRPHLATEYQVLRGKLFPISKLTQSRNVSLRLRTVTPTIQEQHLRITQLIHLSHEVQSKTHTLPLRMVNPGRPDTQHITIEKPVLSNQLPTPLVVNLQNGERINHMVTHLHLLTGNIIHHRKPRNHRLIRTNPHRVRHTRKPKLMNTLDSLLIPTTRTTVTPVNPLQIRIPLSNIPNRLIMNKIPSLKHNVMRNDSIVTRQLRLKHILKPSHLTIKVRDIRLPISQETMLTLTKTHQLRRRNTFGGNIVLLLLRTRTIIVEVNKRDIWLKLKFLKHVLGET